MSTFSFAAIKAHTLPFQYLTTRSKASRGLTKCLKKQDNAKFCVELFALACCIRRRANIH